MEDKKVYIVAEMSANHCQDYDRAEIIVRMAKDVGADAVKLQTYTPDTMTIDSDKKEFYISKGTPWGGETLYELYKRAYMLWDWQPKLKKVADDIGIELFSTPYDKTSVDFLEKMGVARYKIASFEIVDLHFIKYVASKKKPLIISTGTASLGEIKDAVKTAVDGGAIDITLMVCSSAYPAMVEDIKLRYIQHLLIQFPFRKVKISTGLSDHTTGNIAAIAAVSLGARIIEKHLILSHDDPSLDSRFSLEPQEFEQMVKNIRSVEYALKRNDVSIRQSEMASMGFRRSLFIVEDVKKGDELTAGNVRSIRPGYGLSPKHYDEVIGKKVVVNISRGTPLQWKHIR